MGSIGIQIELPIVVRADNVGAIFMSENTSTSSRTKHIDIRYRFMNKMVIDGFLKIVFVKTNKNVAEIFTKNVTSETYRNLVPKFLSEQLSLSDDWFISIGRVLEYLEENQEMIWRNRNEQDQR